jgi:hypothetical protein
MGRLRRAAPFIVIALILALPVGGTHDEVVDQR